MVEKKIIQKVRSGDEKAFRCLYEMYFYKVINYANKILHSREDSREAAQDVFIKLWNKRSELDPEQSVSGLIFRITKCLAIDRIRKRENDLKTLNITTAYEVGGLSLEREYLDEELYSVYRTILEKLPQKRKLIFELSRDKNLSYKEIAFKLNISTKTVEAQVRLALQQIRKDIKKYSDTLFISLVILFFS